MMLYNNGYKLSTIQNDINFLNDDIDITASTSNSITTSISSITDNSSPESSNIEQSSPNNRAKNTLSCSVCGGNTTCRHFGAIACNACAAFFRRTISEKRSYSCAHHGKCTILSDLVRRMCRHCRLKKCFDVGMQESEVLSLGSAIKPTKHKKTLINTIKIKKEYSSSMMPITRFDYDSRYYATDDVIYQIKNAVDSIVHCRMAASNKIIENQNSVSRLPDACKWVLTEAKIFRRFLESSGLSDFVTPSEIHDNIVQITGGWNTSQMLFNTLHFDGCNTNKIHLIDYHYVPLTEKGFLEWYFTEANVKDPFIMQKMGFPIWQRCIDLVANMKSLEFTSIELSVFLTLIMIQFIIKYSNNCLETKKKITPYMNQIFKGMKKYYTENFPSDDYGCKFGRIIMTISSVLDANHLMNEHREYLRLLGKPMVGDQLPYTWSSTNY